MRSRCQQPVTGPFSLCPLPVQHRPFDPPRFHTRVRSFAALVSLALLLAAATQALAHKVLTSAWSEGDAIVGEVGFSNGEMAEAGSVVEVFGPDGAQLGETMVAGDGLFRFTPKQAVSHRFRVDLGAGHVGEVVLGVDELPIGLIRRAEAAEPTSDAVPASKAGEAEATPVTTGVDRIELQAMIAQTLQHEIRPLRKELAAYKEENDLQTVLGGIGYIAGIFGLSFFIAGYRRLRSETRRGPRGTLS